MPIPEYTSRNRNTAKGVLQKEFCKNERARTTSRKNLFSTFPIRCVVCGEIEGKIYCHHKDGNPRNAALENLEWRCPSCHRGIHPSNFGVWNKRGKEQSTV